MSQGDDEDWKRALGGVRPLRDRGKRRPPDARRPPAPEPRPAPAPRFEIERSGELASGRVDGVSREQLHRLRRGEIPVEAELDLHGLDAASAERELRTWLGRARRDGLRCVCVIHGRGLHSESGAVLREALPGWLTAPPLAAELLAFAPAPPRRGGAGATYILLRRSAQAASC